MKRLIGMMLCGLLLCGCAEPTFETVLDDLEAPVMAAAPGKIYVKLPSSATTDAMAEDWESYSCGDFTVSLQSFPGGDISATIREISGFERENLQIFESRQGNNRRYDWVWTAVAEDGDLVFRAAVLEDGAYHYCVTAMAGAKDMEKVQPVWQEVFSSIAIQ